MYESRVGKLNQKVIKKWVYREMFRKGFLEKKLFPSHAHGISYSKVVFIPVEMWKYFCFETFGVK